MGSGVGWAMLGETIGPRRGAVAGGDWLAALAGELAASAGAPGSFEVTAGGRLGAVLAGEADPLALVLLAALRKDARPMRWVCLRGPFTVPARSDAAGSTAPAVGVAVAEGSAAGREPEAMAPPREASAALDAARLHHERLVVRTGNTERDEPLGAMASALAELLSDLTGRQREVARLALLEGLRQSEVADRLGIRRATVSVSFARARVAPLGRLAVAMRGLCAAPTTQAPAAAGPDARPAADPAEAAPSV